MNGCKNGAKNTEGVGPGLKMIRKSGIEEEAEKDSEEKVDGAEEKDRQRRAKARIIILRLGRCEGSIHAWKEEEEEQEARQQD